VFTLFATSAAAAPFLVADVPPGGNPDQCVFTRTVGVTSPIVVDAVNGLPANGNRICKVDLAADPKTGTVTLALRDSVLGVTGPTASYAFGVISAPSNLRVIP
jgi:hypothetical protein